MSHSLSLRTQSNFKLSLPIAAAALYFILQSHAHAPLLNLFGLCFVFLVLKGQNFAKCGPSPWTHWLDVVFPYAPLPCLMFLISCLQNLRGKDGFEFTSFLRTAQHDFLKTASCFSSRFVGSQIFFSRSEGEHFSCIHVVHSHVYLWLVISKVLSSSSDGAKAEQWNLFAPCPKKGSHQNKVQLWQSPNAWRIVEQSGALILLYGRQWRDRSAWFWGGAAVNFAWSWHNIFSLAHACPALAHVPAHSVCLFYAKYHTIPRTPLDAHPTPSQSSLCSDTSCRAFPTLGSIALEPLTPMLGRMWNSCIFCCQSILQRIAIYPFIHDRMTFVSRAHSMIPAD